MNSRTILIISPTSTMIFPTVPNILHSTQDISPQYSRYPPPPPLLMINPTGLNTYYTEYLLQLRFSEASRIINQTAGIYVVFLGVSKTQFIRRATAMLLPCRTKSNLLYLCKKQWNVFGSARQWLGNSTTYELGLRITFLAFLLIWYCCKTKQFDQYIVIILPVDLP